MEQKQTHTHTIPETSPFVEALQAVLQAEDKTLSGFSAIYGEETPQDGGKTGGESMFSQTGLSSLFEELKSALKTQIGEVVELSLQGLLSSDMKPQGEKEGVC